MKKVVVLVSLLACFINMSCNSEKKAETLFYNSLKKEKDVLKNKKNIVKLLDNGQYCFYVDEIIIRGKISMAEYLSKNYKGKSVNFISELKLTPIGVDDYINFFNDQGVILKSFFVPSSQCVERLDVLPFYLKTYPEKDLPESIKEIRRNIRKNIQAERAERVR